jgi:hypothetical protein
VGLDAVVACLGATASSELVAFIVSFTLGV